MPKRRFEQRLEDYRNGKVRKVSTEKVEGARHHRRPGLRRRMLRGVSGKSRGGVRGALEPYAPKADTREKRQAQASRDRSGRARRGAAVARPREPGGVYMEGKPLVRATAARYLQVRHMRDSKATTSRRTRFL